MTEQDSELINAASQGAAAAVAAVQDEQLKETIIEDSNSAANEAAVSAEYAAENAAMAVDTSNEAASIAESAAINAVNAGEAAQVAAEVAFDAKEEIARMRQEFEERHTAHQAEMRAMLEEFRPKRSEEPTEVTVNESRGNTAAEESRDNPRSGGSIGAGKRHKFGKRIQ